MNSLSDENKMKTKELKEAYECFKENLIELTTLEIKTEVADDTVKRTMEQLTNSIWLLNTNLAYQIDALRKSEVVK